MQTSIITKLLIAYCIAKNLFTILLKQSVVRPKEMDSPENFFKMQIYILIICFNFCHLAKNMHLT